MKKLLLLAIAVVLFPVVSYAASASLTWTANTETNLVGYKVYRGTGAQCTSTTPLSTLVASNVEVPNTSFVDNTVPVFNGTLCYEVTAHNIHNLESPRSNRASKEVELSPIPPVAPTGLSIGIVTP